MPHQHLGIYLQVGTNKEFRLPLGKTWETFEHNRVPLALRHQLDQLAEGGLLGHGVSLLAFGLPCTVLGWLQEDPDASAVVLLGRLQEAEPDRFSRAHLRTLQRRVQQWRGIMSKELVYATAGEPMAGLPAMPELALVGVDPKC